VGDRCERCDKPIATDNDWEATPEGEGEGLCWGAASCCAVDWRARAMAAETERDTLRSERDRLLKREEHFASVLRVTDSGQYRADWNSAIRRVVDERDALRAIVEGRPTAPTQEDIAAHPGQWLVYYAARFEDRQPARTRLLDRTRATAAAAARWPTAPSRWCPVRDGRPCAWPVVEVSRG
jgi:hypothetical protein